jgi:hypothetical protein
MATSRPTALPVARVQGEDSRSPLFGADHVSGLGLGKPASDTPAREGKMVNRPVFAPETQEQTVSTRGERDKRALNSLSFWLEHPLGKGEVVSSILPGSTRKSTVLGKRSRGSSETATPLPGFAGAHPGYDRYGTIATTEADRPLREMGTC